jgi:formamidopyrimidine-DNA glycosylase
MPELPEVETVRRGLQPVMEGVRVIKLDVRRPDLRWPFPLDLASRVEGQRVRRLTRRAKYLLLELASDDVLLMHLGMSGSFRIRHDTQERIPGAYHHGRSKAETHDHIVFHMEGGASVTFNDPRRFGFMLLTRLDELEAHPLLRALGPEPLGNEFNAVRLAGACRGKKTSLKAALSDQRVVAGLGNIYVCEALHRARLSPKRGAATLASRSGAPTPRAEALVSSIRAVLEDAITAGGSSLRDHRRTDGELGLFQHAFRVYDKEGKPCVTPNCRGRVRRIVQGGRSTFYCPVCQR